MSKPSYCTIQRSLAERFRELVREGMSPAEAVERIAELYYAFHFRIVQQLPRGHLTFDLGAAGELVAKLDGGPLDPERILTRPPHGLDPTPIPLEQYRWMAADPRQAERDALGALSIDVPPVAPAEPQNVQEPRPGKRGRKPYDVWEPMFAHLENLVREREDDSRPTPRPPAAILEAITEERGKEGRGTPTPTLQTIAEKIGKERPRSCYRLIPDNSANSNRQFPTDSNR